MVSAGPEPQELVGLQIIIPVPVPTLATNPGVVPVPDHPESNAVQRNPVAPGAEATNVAVGVPIQAGE